MFIPQFLRSGKSGAVVVRAEEVEPARPRWASRALWILWALVAVKSAATIWAVAHYQLPVRWEWVVFPTVAFALVITVVLVRRRV